MNRGGSFNHNNMPYWDTTFSGRSSSKLDNCRRFGATNTMRFPAAAHPNDFNRYPFQQPRFPMGNNLHLNQRFSSNVRGRSFVGRGGRQQQERFDNFTSGSPGPCRPARMMFQNFSNDLCPAFRTPYQNPFQNDIIQRTLLPIQRALLPLPSHGNTGRPCGPIVQRMDFCPRNDVVEDFQPMAGAAVKGYITVKNFETPFNSGVPAPILKENEQCSRQSGGVGRHLFLKGEDKHIRQLNIYPQLPMAAHNFLRQTMDSDTEILAYFEVEMRLFRNKIVVTDTLAHVVLTKHLKTGLTWVLAFFKGVLLETEPEPNILAYRNTVNRSMNLHVVGNYSLSLESDESEECVVLNFQNFQECQRFQSLFSRQKSINLRKRNSNEGMEEISEKRSKDYSSSPTKRSEPVAWITKLPPEIAKFHSSPEKESETKKIPSDEFIYDSSTFSNALNKSSSERSNLVDGCGKESSQDSPSCFAQENKADINNNDDIIFSAKNVCLLMKPDADSVDYRSPGYGTLAVIKNENTYNQLDFIDNNGALKCRHYIDHSNLIKCEKTVSNVEFGCVWQAFAEVFNSPKPIRSIMHFKVILSPLESGRFMDAMDDSVAKANRLARGDTWSNEFSTSSSTVRYL